LLLVLDLRLAIGFSVRMSDNLRCPQNVLGTPLALWAF